MEVMEQILANTARFNNRLRNAFMSNRTIDCLWKDEVLMDGFLLKVLPHIWHSLSYLVRDQRPSGGA